MSAAPSDDLAARIAALEAVEEIKRVKYRYLRACDRKQPEVFRACFADQAVLDYGEKLGSFTGVEGIARLFEAIALKKVDGHYVVFDMHHAVHPDIRLTSADTADGDWSLRFRQVNLERGTETIGAIEYSDTYVRVDGAWLIGRSEVRELWTKSSPLPEGSTVRGSLA